MLQNYLLSNMVKKVLGHLQFLHQVRKVASWRDLQDRLLRKYEINPNWFHLGKLFSSYGSFARLSMLRVSLQKYQWLKIDRFSCADVEEHPEHDKHEAKLRPKHSRKKSILDQSKKIADAPLARAWNSSLELQTATTIGAARTVAQKWAQNLFLRP